MNRVLLLERVVPFFPPFRTYRCRKFPSDGDGRATRTDRVYELCGDPEVAQAMVRRVRVYTRARWEKADC